MSGPDVLACIVLVVAWVPLSLLVGANAALACVVCIERERLGDFVRDLQAWPQR